MAPLACGSLRAPSALAARFARHIPRASVPVLAPALYTHSLRSAA
jgi:hypothetical protein